MHHGLRGQRMRKLHLLPLPFALFAFVPLHAPAQEPRFQRCTDASGQSVYTDKSCSDVGANQRLPSTDAGSDVLSADESHALYRNGCSHTMSDLVWQITASIRARDANRLANVYAWRDVGENDAGQAMARLETLVQRPLLDIKPILPDASTAPAAAPETDDASKRAQPAPPQSAQAAAGAEVEPAKPVHPHPVGLRLEQTLKDSATPSSTDVRLRREFGCFWIAF